MTPEEIKLNIQEPGTYIVKFGSLPQDKEPTPLNINGNIDVVSNFIKARQQEILNSQSYVKVEEESGKITLVIDEKCPFKTVVTGVLSHHPDFLKWGINTDKQYSSLDLAHMIKMNRFMFPSTSQAMELVSVFQTLKAKVQKEVELSDDKRGNKTNLQSQVVLNMSIPTGFKLKTPIFKGFEPVEFEVEIAINADTLSIQLISPAVSDIVGTIKAGIIQEQVKRIEGFELVEVPILYC